MRGPSHLHHFHELGTPLWFQMIAPSAPSTPYMKLSVASAGYTCSSAARTFVKHSTASAASPMRDPQVVLVADLNAHAQRSGADAPVTPCRRSGNAGSFEQVHAEHAQAAQRGKARVNGGEERVCGQCEGEKDARLTVYRIPMFTSDLTDCHGPRRSSFWLFFAQ
ncbi:hypothetical protein GGX14DRAFT_404914 [Mycena pura]|uniref:Uncharacterized protein n=1 Tax=Mycena pura TaxID=153505 RepID=A0AAD6UTG1_9AGAR|nr:hypothetical protein GGX14DRAFT_404914 [Mycena pura]